MEKSLTSRKAGSRNDRAAAVRDVIEQWQRTPEFPLSRRATDVETATRRYALYVLLPLWFAPGLLDYVMHRRTVIYVRARLPLPTSGKSLGAVTDDFATVGDALKRPSVGAPAG